MCDGARHPVEHELDDDAIHAYDDHADGWSLTGRDQAVRGVGQFLVPAELR